MKRKTKFFTALSILIISITTSQASTRSEVQYLVKKYNLSDAKIAIATQRTINGNQLYAYAQNRAMKPASNNKVFTIVAALFAIPSDFRFTTSIMYPSDRVKDHTLYGDLYIKFTGNPALTGSELATLIKKIKIEKGISKITGDVYLVGVFSGPYIPDGWSKEDSTFCYGAPASSFTLNRNCTVIKLVKNTNSLTTRVVELSNASNITIKNTAKYTSASNATTIEMNDDNVLYIGGYLSRAAEKMFKLAIRNPALKTLDTVNDFLNSDGIKHGNIVIASSVPTGYTEQITTRSQTIGHFIDQTLKHSDNLYAETILNTIGLKEKGIGSTKAGTEAVQSILYSKLGLDTSALTMYDGSGLSHLDRVTPEFMVNFLTKAYNSQIGKEFYNYLPASGMSGTISYRMGGKLLGRVHAKTGTLSGVSTLSGYLLTAKNHRISFSIMLNDLKPSDRYNARRFQDKLVDVFYRNL
ncbi:D-alanyl-D-alanine carboxypeptidase/D-alanyl-D-alanine-endopeptidase [Francisella tularensis subsp. novicida]|uniref:D-alanyl-D-alanine carboxypeptidase/D-alanyl-D-alanine endopeptidase n=3 Tax=Francisella tularensis TaxID=263 RepID=UPI000158AF29|nr:D-alanyl-D-alanine carboxypeptidase/D-alanyl-D-alanine-endopeptidase [Francisella tularensis]AJI44972.1 D-alanyl-D-alanine carboxypeptidase/D-alanyl-D-alanine-endopeptidase [Francisella tularensis subsp. novicida F6168]AJJ48022.1 D-alanyl-D-alanine carboxypeptidase/D-alanyl-D-alanine-endopeptidase [Francisella tularensis subsp. novicida]APC98576.1 D-alanyl-D-alanine carboxypeptidase/D-alanyl-D-alanine-endopeptidase [Francisella tularensis subsp. novicida]EDN36255.1 D-alanyl-D-alanine carboxy